MQIFKWKSGLYWYAVVFNEWPKSTFPLHISYSESSTLMLKTENGSLELVQKMKKVWDRITAFELFSRLVRSAFWVVAGAVFSRGMLFVASIIIARLLGRELYGEFGIVRSTLNMFLVFAGFGLGLTATKHVAEYKLTNPSKAGRVIHLSVLFAVLMGAVVSLLLFVFAPLLVSNIMNAPHLVEELRIGSTVLFLSAICGAQMGVLNGFEEFKSVAKINLLVGIISLPVLIGGTYFGGIKGSVWALSVNVLLSVFLNQLIIRSKLREYGIKCSTNDCFTEWPILWRFSVPAVLGAMMASPAIWICNVMLVNQQAGFIQMGMFDAANQVKMILIFVPGALGQIVLPTLSSLLGKGNYSMYKKAIKYNLLLNIGITLIIALPVLLFSRSIMECYGPGFEEGWLALQLLVVSAVLIVVNNVIGQAIASKGRMWVGFMFNLMWAIVLVSLSYNFIENGYGGTGLAAGNALAYFCHTVLQSFYLRYILQETEDA